MKSWIKKTGSIALMVVVVAVYLGIAVVGRYYVWRAAHPQAPFWTFILDP